MKNPKARTLDAKTIQGFTQLIADHTGLALKNLDVTTLSEKISIRIKACKLESSEDYYRLLDASTKASFQEWQKLISLLTNNESYFFRDRAQFNLLRKTILPKLIERRYGSKTLSICSAGCSTGEEPYSLAIVLRELIPNLEQWNINIHGIDIDEIALERARKGIYSSWSFRGVSEAYKQRYFQEVNHYYHLVPEVKSMVRFQSANLVKDAFHQTHSRLRDIDLFICRNVFIYFDATTIGEILAKIYHCLHPQGYFIAGHTELHSQNLSYFHKQAFPESVVYRRKEADFVNKPAIVTPSQPQLTARKLTKPKPIKKRCHPQQTGLKKLAATQKLAEKKALNTPTPSLSPKKTDQLRPAEKYTLEAAQRFCKSQQYDLAIQALQQVLLNQPKNLQACFLVAQIYANLGKYEEAVHYCYQALDFDSLFVNPYYLLAQIAEEQGNSKEAKRILKQIIYLDPDYPLAYLDLSQIYQREGDTTRAVKMQQAALCLLKTLPPETKIEEKDVTVAELILQLEAACRNGI